MKFASWKNIGELLGVTAIVASLIFVGLQMQQDQDIAIADTYGSLAESTANLADLVDRNAEIWQRGLDGEALSITDRIKFLALAKAIQTHFSHIHIRWNQIGPIAPDVAARRYAHALFIYPGLRKARADQIQALAAANVPLAGTFTSAGFEREVDRFLNEFAEAATAIPSEKSYVFW